MGAQYEAYPLPRGNVPKGWVETTVGEVLIEWKTGFASGKHNSEGSGIPHLRPMNVSSTGEILMNDVRYVAAEAGRSRLVEGDILFTNTSSTVWVGKSAVVKMAQDWAFSNHMTCLRTSAGINPEFVARQLHYLCLSGYFAFHCKKHVNQSSISPQQLTEKTPFRLPPTREQNRIVKQLNSLLDKEQENLEEIKSISLLLQDFRVSILQAACSGHLLTRESVQLDPKNDDTESASVLLQKILSQRRKQWEEQQTALAPSGKHKSPLYLEPEGPRKTFMNRLPVGWTWASLEQITSASRNIRYGILMPKNHVDDGVPYVKVKDIKNDIINVQGLQRTTKQIANKYSKSSLQGGDVLITIRGTYGKIAVVPDELSGGNITQDTARLALTNLVDRDYIVWHLRSQYSQEYFHSVAKGIAVRGTNIEDVRSTPIALPPLCEQRKIATEINRLLSAVTNLPKLVNEVLEKAQQLRIAFLKKAMAGELVLQDVNDEPADKLLLEVKKTRKALLDEAKSQSSMRMKRIKQPQALKHDLLTVLRKHPEGLTPERLFDMAGYTKDEISLFYQHLRVIEPNLLENRPGGRQVILSHR